MQRKFLFTLAVALLLSTSAIAANNYNYQSANYPQENLDKKNETLKGRTVTVPAGEVFRGIVTTPLGSDTLTLGQNVTLALGIDFYYNGNLIAPAGSSVNGTVLEVAKAKHGTVNGKLLIRFTQIVTPYGIQIPISAVIKTDNDKGVLTGGPTLDVIVKENTKNIVKTIGEDDLKGYTYRTISNGNAGKTSIGAAVGTGGGIIKGIWDKGEDVYIPVNSLIEVILTQPITINPSINQNNF